MAPKITLRDQVIYCLTQDPHSRNSDIRLTQVLWWNYYNSYFIKGEDDKWLIRVGDLWSLPREDNIKRVRAKIQNDENKFLPTDPEVCRKRKIKEEDWRRYLGYNPEFRTSYRCMGKKQ